MIITLRSRSGTDLWITAPMAQLLCHRLMGWLVLGSHLGTGSKTERVLKTQWVGVWPLHPPSSLLLTSNRVTTNYVLEDNPVDNWSVYS